MFFPLRKISNRIIFLVLALETLSISFWGFATYSSSRNELLKSIDNRLDEVSLRMQSELNHFMDPISIHLRAIGETIRSLNLDRSDIIPAINELFKSRQELEEISVTDINGHEIYRYSRMRNYSEQEYRDLSSDPLIQNATIHGYSNDEIRFSKYYEPVKRIVVKVENERGQSFFLDATINLKWIWKLEQQQEIGNSGYVYIVSSDGKLISYPDHSFVLKGINVFDFIPKKLFRTSDKRKMEIYNNLTDKEVVGVSLYDQQMRWWIVVELPTKESFAPLQRMLNWFIFIFICAALFTIATVLVFTKIMMRPLDAIMDAINSISAGKSGVQVHIHTDSELSVLANGINAMASNLDRRIQELTESEARNVALNKSLEIKVAEATSQLRASNAKLAEVAEREREASDVKSMFLANTSHELRTPLNAILGYSEIINEIADEKGDTQLADDTAKIISSAKYLLQLINALLDLSRIEKGKLQIDPETINVSQFLDVIYDIAAPLASNNNNIFSIEYENVEEIYQDATRLKQIIINLVGNACKFTTNGQVTLKVYSITTNNEEFIHFHVHDTGIGMTSDQLKKLFVAFQQADSTTTKQYGGTGLGLALSKQLAILMKGNIHASSVQNEGSDFTLILPRYYKTANTPVTVNRQSA